eukprot:18540-Pleurochrysis_carterae.AAC.4
MPACLRKDEIPSGRWYGPEKSRSTVRDDEAGAPGRCGGQSWWLIVAGIVSGGSHRRVGDGWRGLPWKRSFVEINLSGEHDSGNARNVDVVSAGCRKAATKVYSNPSTGLDADFREGFAWFDGEGPATEREDGYDAWLHS